MPDKLELHQVRPVPILQGEAGCQVGLHLSIESRQERSIQALLVVDVISRQLLLLGLRLVKELLRKRMATTHLSQKNKQRD